MRDIYTGGHTRLSCLLHRKQQN